VDGGYGVTNAGSKFQTCTAAATGNAHHQSSDELHVEQPVLSLPLIEDGDAIP